MVPERQARPGDEEPDGGDCGEGRRDSHREGEADGEGGLTVWQGADVVVGITVSWVPYAADYTRFSKTRRGAFAGATAPRERPKGVADPDPAELPEPEVAGALVVVRGVTRTRAGVPM